ncbi:MAG: DinB family protein [Tepidiformaceae bacterium]
MTPTHQATLDVTRQSFAMLKEAITGLPDEAFDWTPVPGTNSLTVLTRHCIAASRFFGGVASGVPGSIAEYRKGDRAQAFHAMGGSAASLAAAIDGAIAEAGQILSKGTDAHLAELIGWPDEAPDMPTRTGAEILVNGVGHLREHVGQAQLMRDLWLARNA